MILKFLEALESNSYRPGFLRPLEVTRLSLTSSLGKGLFGTEIPSLHCLFYPLQAECWATLLNSTEVKKSLGTSASSLPSIITIPTFPSKVLCFSPCFKHTLKKQLLTLMFFTSLRQIMLIVSFSDTILTSSC